MTILKTFLLTALFLTGTVISAIATGSSNIIKGPYNMGESGIVRYEDVYHPVVARKGMVSSQNAQATSIGVDILKAGGNAVD